MNQPANVDLAYPLGRFQMPKSVDVPARETYIAEIEAAPRLLRTAVEGLNAKQLDTPYRPGGWSVRQVVHHLPDSHINAYVRFKLALTEDSPTIKTYEEAEWAKLPDAMSGHIAFSLALLDAVHTRWIACLRAIPPDAFDRVFRHPETGPMSLNQQLALYAWHGRHHVAHITSLASREGWK